MSLTGSPLAPVEEMIHGVLVRDPYRWLEDRTLPETEEWIRKQQCRCDEYFASCADLNAIRDRVRQYLDIEVIDQPAKVCQRYFYRRRGQGEEQSSIYVRDRSDGAERRLVTASSLGSFVSVGIHRIADDGSLLAYELKDGGTDRKAIHIVEVESGRILPEIIETGYARGFCFTADCRGFYYCHEVPHLSAEHTIRSRPDIEAAEDHVCFRVARTRGSRLVLTADHALLGAISIHQHEGEAVVDFWVAERSEPERWHCVFTNRRLPFSPILKQGRIFAISYEDAPNGRLIELDFSGNELRTVVPERNTTIRQLSVAGDRIFISYLDCMVPSIQSWSFSGNKLGYPKVPTDGTIQLMPNLNDAADSIFYSYETLTRPVAIFEYRIDAAEAYLWHQRRNPIDLQFASAKLTYPSGDDSPIPITLSGSELTGMLPHQRPVIMTSYGGFGVPMTPQFSVLVCIMMELGAVFALPHIRGGGEFGNQWHEAARRRNR